MCFRGNTPLSIVDISFPFHAFFVFDYSFVVTISSRNLIQIKEKSNRSVRGSSLCSDGIFKSENFTNVVLHDATLHPLFLLFISKWQYPKKTSWVVSDWLIIIIWLRVYRICLNRLSYNIIEKWHLKCNKVFGRNIAFCITFPFRFQNRSFTLTTE